MFHLLAHNSHDEQWIYIGAYGDRSMASTIGNSMGNFMIIEGLVVEKVLLPVNDEDRDYFDCRDVPH